jgi:hypothetical protein
LLEVAAVSGVGWALAGPAWAASSDPAYAWEWPVPWLPDSDADIVVVQVPPSGIVISDVGSARKLLLLVAPQEPITGTIRGRFLRYRGVVMIGGTLRPEGGAIFETPAGTLQPGRHLFQISFDNKDRWDGEPPFLFLANLDVACLATRWGDFLRTGTTRNAANTNFAQWCDVYLQKIRVEPGHYGWTPPGGSQEPHSDFLQVPFGATGSIRVYDCDIAWGYQTFFTRVQAPDPAHPTAVHRFKRVYTRCLPDDPEIHKPGANRTQYHLNAMGYQEDLDSGRYQPHAIWDWHLGGDPEGNATLLSHFNLRYLTPVFIGNRLAFRHTIPPNRAVRVVSGYFTTTPPAETFAPPEQIGWQKRVGDSATLRTMVAVEE